MFMLGTFPKDTNLNHLHLIDEQKILNLISIRQSDRLALFDGIGQDLLNLLGNNPRVCYFLILRLPLQAAVRGVIGIVGVPERGGKP